MFRSQLAQFFPPKPTFTEANVPPQDGKVFIVTGGASGIGLELSKMLYQKGGRVYIAGRSEEDAQRAIQTIQAAVPSPSASAALIFLHLDLSDLTTIKTAVAAFQSQESTLHVLFNNAGVSQPPLGSLSKQRIELQLATNCLGPFLLTQLLLPLLEATAATTTQTPTTVRVIWTASQMIELAAPRGIVLPTPELRTPPADTARCYTNSKTGNYLLAAELARQQQERVTTTTATPTPTGSNAAGVVGAVPVLSIATNPGAASTALFRHTPWTGYLAWPLLHAARLAALTQLYAGLAGEVAEAAAVGTAGAAAGEVAGAGAGGQGKGFCYVVPWGRVATVVRQDLVDAGRLVGDGGGSGKAREFWEFCEEVTGEYR
ncbi:hypothetical protein CHGG_03783 [Chaetomium globosum CBS 148.51]|uniref:NAD(P)-binding protein n=1 Tax=Chaetomium globosum (strain ATCC 6205 / CBS 148.51 / DSM 1962 / NBRC 6347 / NRRL 1970) TaxID=306901 RepID=Q2H363_CHAGB|nr:uncharacterized protein CHGG_03783 [Chaetomium globosum CBS 148.51]EAQ87164.1 hypothetical protein CHGG_03783 [Chaetomium globosum CBS 148.51]